MSGIFCIFNLDGRPVEQATVVKALAPLVGGRKQVSKARVDGCVALGVARPEGNGVGWPEMLEAEGCILAFDGRVDNREVLIADLEIPRSMAQGPSDAWLVARAYGRWGRDCPKHLIGSFVFLLWDRHRRRLTAVRDQLGTRVLYVYRTPSLLAVATSPKVLFSVPGVPRRLSQAKIANWLVMDRVRESTLYEGIDYLPAASVSTVSEHEARCDYYWQADLARRVVYADDQDYVDAFRALFEQAVACRLRGHSAVGAFMSGGLDSSSVAVVAAQQLVARGRRLTVFSHVPPRGFAGPARPERYNDEAPLVEAIRDCSGNMDLYYLRSEGKTQLDGLDAFFDMVQAPILAVANRCWMQEGLEAAQRLGLRVMLGGGRGNLTFSFDGWNRLRELALTGRWGELLRELRAASGNGPFSMPTLIKHMVIGPLLPNLVWRVRGRLRAKRQGPGWSAYSALNPALATALGLDERLTDAPTPPSGVLGDGRAQRMALLRSGAADNGAAIMQAWGSGLGLGISDPTADLRVVEYSLAIPLAQYLRNGESRWLARRAMAGRLPPSVLHNIQRGSQSADWYLRLSAARPRIGAELDRLEKNDTARQCLDLATMRRLLEDWPQGNWTDPEVVCHYDFLLSTGLMMGRFILWFEGQGGPG